MISNLEKADYEAVVVNAEQPAQSPIVTDPDHVERLLTAFHEGMWVSGFGSFQVTEKNPPSDLLSFAPPAVDG